MSSLIDSNEMEEDFPEVPEQVETPPEAFLLALKNALVQLEHHANSSYP
jgi:hypothetical protein